MINIIILIFILFFIGSITGRTLNILPLIFILFIFLLFNFGMNVFIFLISNPLLLVVLGIAYFIKRKNAPKTKRNGKFYYYSSGGSQEDFEEFFRRASGYSNNGYSNSGQYGNVFQNSGATDEDYERLGIRKGATKDEVKKAYREKAKLHHPDKYASASEEEKLHQEKKIKEINESYERISKELE